MLCSNRVLFKDKKWVWKALLSTVMKMRLLSCLMNIDEERLGKLWQVVVSERALLLVTSTEIVL